MGRVILHLAAWIGAIPIPVELDVVQADITALLGMDVLEREGLIADTVAYLFTRGVTVSSKNGLDRYVGEWSTCGERTPSKHVYAKMSFACGTFFARSQLLKLHQQFFYPSVQNLFNLLRKAWPDEATLETLSVLEHLTRKCEPCQLVQDAPRRIGVLFGAENGRFNERILFDIMYINKRAILDAVDEGTHFFLARFLPDVSTRTIWKAILECWSTMYTALLNLITVDQGSALGALFIIVGAISNVEVQRIGIEAH